MKKLLSVLVLLILLLYPVTAFADFGPKSSLDIFVKNAPQGVYYLDLLTANNEGMYVGECDTSDKMYNILWKYNLDGFQTVQHLDPPIVYGSLTGEYRDGYMHHRFLNTPSVFKIIIVTSDGVIHVSQTCRRMKFKESVYLDYNTMKITPAGGGVLVDWLMQFLQTFSATILIEGIILLLFGFKLKDNWKPFVLVNLCTQIFLIVSTGLIMMFSDIYLYILLFLLIEAVIIIVESTLYKKLLWRKKEGGRIAYTVTANLISLLLSLIVIWAEQL